MAVKLALDETGAKAFARTSIVLPVLAQETTELAKDLTDLAEDLVLIPAVKASDTGLSGIDTVHGDLSIIVSQIKDANIKARLNRVIERLKAMHLQKPKKKADLSTGDLADAGGLKPQQGPRFVVELRDKKYVVVDTQDDTVVSTHDTKADADAAAKAKNTVKAEDELEKFECRILKFNLFEKDDEEEIDISKDERTVLGIVLEPEVIDSQNDVESADEIRKTAWKFMEKFQQFGLMHKKIVPSVLPLESYLAPVDFEVNGQKVKKGSWLVRVRVLDDAIWKAVRSGKLTGFSIGGSAVRKPEKVAV